MAIPKYDELFNPVLKALHNLGGSATNQELEDQVIEILQLPDEDVYERREGKSQTRLNYRIAWAKSYLKKTGYVDNTERGVWALTARGQKATDVDPADVKAFVRAEFAKKRRVGTVQDEEPEDEDTTDAEVSWQDTLLSFHVYFQCKRYRNTVGPSIVRDFRGAMMGRADKGLIITTGTFTRDAIAEATRDGATPIDLIDGPELMDRQKDLGLAITVSKRVVEDIEIKPEWFQAI